MDLAMIGWISLGWLMVSVMVSLAVGRMFQHGGINDTELELAAERQRVVRYLRERKALSPKTAKQQTAARRSNAQ